MKRRKLTLEEMTETRGGDWFETTWGVMLGSAFVAGLGASAFLAVAVGAGAALVMEDYL